MPMMVDKTLKVNGKMLTLTRLNKVLYPEAGFTKAEVLEYYTQISPFMLPHLRNRMLTFKRYPEGTNKAFFYEKRCPSYKPAWLKTKKVKSAHGAKDIPYCEIENLAGMLWASNLASLEFHIFLSTSIDVDSPTSVVFDLDPGPGRNLCDCCKNALKMRDLFLQMKLQTFTKTSGGKGLHLYIPLNTPIHFDQTKTFAHQTATLLEKKYPEEITSNMKKTAREKRILIDWSQNDAHKTTVCVYSLRAKDKPYVSTPLEWKEVEHCAKTKKESPYKFTAQDVLKRVKSHGDLFKSILTLKQKLPVLSHP